jgi:hypothetical protein
MVELDDFCYGEVGADGGVVSVPGICPLEPFRSSFSFWVWSDGGSTLLHFMQHCIRMVASQAPRSFGGGRFEVFVSRTVWSLSHVRLTTWMNHPFIGFQPSNQHARPGYNVLEISILRVISRNIILRAPHRWQITIHRKILHGKIMFPYRADLAIYKRGVAWIAVLQRVPIAMIDIDLHSYQKYASHFTQPVESGKTR